MHFAALACAAASGGKTKVAAVMAQLGWRVEQNTCAPRCQCQMRVLLVQPELCWKPPQLLSQAPYHLTCQSKGTLFRCEYQISFLLLPLVITFSMYSYALVSTRNNMCQWALQDSHLRHFAGGFATFHNFAVSSESADFRADYIAICQAIQRQLDLGGFSFVSPTHATTQYVNDILTPVCCAEFPWYSDISANLLSGSLASPISKWGFFAGSGE